MDLDDDDYDQVLAALEILEVQGPSLRRPLVGTIKNSKHKNMKEIRPLGGNLRILFAFDPLRQAILLVAGDKTNNWDRWYRDNIPIADKRYTDHLKGKS